MNTPEVLKRPREFFEECLSELRKVHWPTREETRAATIAVLVGVTILAVYLGAVDFLLSIFIRQVLR